MLDGLRYLELLVKLKFQAPFCFVNPKYATHLPVAYPLDRFPPQGTWIRLVTTTTMR